MIITNPDIIGTPPTSRFKTSITYKVCWEDVYLKLKQVSNESFSTEKEAQDVANELAYWFPSLDVWVAKPKQESYGIPPTGGSNVMDPTKTISVETRPVSGDVTKVIRVGLRSVRQ